MVESFERLNVGLAARCTALYLFRINYRLELHVVPVGCRVQLSPCADRMRLLRGGGSPRHGNKANKTKSKYIKAGHQFDRPVSYRRWPRLWGKDANAHHSYGSQRGVYEIEVCFLHRCNPAAWPSSCAMETHHSDRQPDPRKDDVSDGAANVGQRTSRTVVSDVLSLQVIVTASTHEPVRDWKSVDVR